MSKRLLTDEQIVQARKHLDDGWTYARVAEKFGCHHMTIRRMVDDNYADRKEERAKQIVHEPLQAGRVADFRSVKAAAIERLADVPKDTRNLTARLLGDPLPGRSAWDQRKHP